MRHSIRWLFVLSVAAVMSQESGVGAAMEYSLSPVQAAAAVEQIDNTPSWRGMEYWLRKHGYDAIPNGEAGGWRDGAVGVERALFDEWYNPTLQRRAVITHTEFYDDLAVYHTYENIQFFWTENGTQKTGDCYWDSTLGVVEVTDTSRSWLIYANQWAICAGAACGGSAVGCLYTGPGYATCLGVGCVGAGAVGCAIGVALSAVLPH